MREATIRKLIKFACHECECPELARKGKIKVIFETDTGWPANFLAEAEYDPDTDSGTIKFDKKSWTTLSLEHKEELLLHEVAHIICDKIHRRKRKMADHGDEWKAVMKRLGFADPKAHLDC